MTQTSIDVVPTTLETTDATLVVTSPYTSTEFVVLPTTQVVNYCNSYKFVASSGTFNGQYVTGVTPDDSSIDYGNPIFSSDATQALTYVFHSDGTVSTATNNDFLAAAPGFNYVYQLTQSSLAYYTSLTILYCSIEGPAPLPNAAGSVSCTYNGQAIIFETCPSDQTGGRPNYILKDGSVDGGCTGFNLAAIFVGEVPC